MIKENYSKSPKRKLKDEYLMAIFEQLADKPEMKIPQMIIFIKDNYNVELSRSTIMRSLIESDYRYIGPKIRPKNSIKKNKKKEIVKSSSASELEFCILFRRNYCLSWESCWI